jgi:hypothetical protein
MNKLKTPALLLSAIIGLSIKGFNREPVNLKTIDHVFTRFREAPSSLISYPKIAYEKGFYKDYFREELRGTSYIDNNNDHLDIPFNVVLDSLANEAVKLNRSHNNDPRKSGKAYLKDINNDREVGVGKESGYYFKSN